MPAQIAHIIGSGRSGSTILDMMLGAHPRAFSTGSVDVIDQFVETDNYCTCRRSLTDCPVWGAALGTDARGGRSVPPSLNVDGQVRKALAIVPAIVRGRPSSMPVDEIELNWRLMDEVERVTGAEVLIDSSKTLMRFARMAALRPERDLRMIHLVRDPRGFVLSRSKSRAVRPRAASRAAPASSTRRSRSSTGSCRTCFVAVYGRLRRRGRYMVVAYEDLVAEPAATLERICTFLGLDFQPELQLPPLEGEFHLIGGNAARLVFTELRPDVRWRTELPRSQRWIVQLGAGWLAALLRRAARRPPPSARPLVNAPGKRPPAVVYITGSGRSGSTILDMMLGANSRALGLGQVDELERWVAGSQRCTCGRPLGECPVWGPALEASPAPGPLNVEGQVAKTLAILPAVRGHAPTEADPASVDATWSLYDRVAEIPARRR